MGEAIHLTFMLLIFFQIKHFLADYPLQTTYMLSKFKKKGWVWPLTEHCFMHALFTFAIVFMISPFVVALTASLFDFVVHFTMDRIKASPNLLGRFKQITPHEYEHIMHIRHANPVSCAKYGQKELVHNKIFWWSIGLDQAVHHLTHYAIIYYTVMFNGFKGCDLWDSFYCLSEFWRML